VGGALACGGHPLIVEACVSLGGKDVKAGHNVFRFANRIPLLFEAGSDVVTRCVQRLNWSSYKIDKNNDKIGIFVSIVSTKIPFKGTSKEYIGDDNVEIAEAVDRAIRACATQLKGKIVRAQAAKERRARKKVRPWSFPKSQPCLPVQDVNHFSFPKKDFRVRYFRKRSARRGAGFRFLLEKKRIRIRIVSIIPRPMTRTLRPLPWRCSQCSRRA
jgi:hypothetical protein